MLRARRGTRGLRSVAQEIGEISASTLSRIEQGGVPDLETYLRITKWLGIQTEHQGLSGAGETATPELIEAHFRAEKVLPPDTIQALSDMIRQAYKWAENRGIGTNPSK
ncbi:helix-turn-helix domain-containing protein [Prosthecobacter fusiformis]|jgi:transcriptional regulator with XRE-family HTH domain|nr:helix-turn-helix transcriptional regulator [Prosthecobacter fusiformis]